MKERKQKVQVGELQSAYRVLVIPAGVPRGQYLDLCCFLFIQQTYQALFKQAQLNATNLLRILACPLSPRSSIAAEQLQDCVTRTDKGLAFWKPAVNVDLPRRNLLTKFEIVLNDKPLERASSWPDPRQISGGETMSTMSFVQRVRLSD